MILKFEDYTKERLEDDVWGFQRYFKFNQSNTYGHNDELDAFRTGYKQAFISYFYGEKVAEKLSEAESSIDTEFNNETLRETSMKMWNGRVGREVAQKITKQTKGKNYTKEQIKAAIAYEIGQNIYNGKMMTSLSDTRKYDEFEDVYFDKSDEENNVQNPKAVLEGSVKQDEYIDKRNTVNNTPQEQQVEYVKTPCVGTVNVPPYTRKDGTEVDGYTRKCGAKHIAKKTHNILLNPWNTPYQISTDKNSLNVQELLSKINNFTNKNNSDAKLLMDISIYSPKAFINSKLVKYIQYDEIKTLGKNLGLNIDEKLDGVFFDSNSNFAKNIVNSSEFKAQISKEQIENNPNKKIYISFNKDTNLFRALHNVTVCNVRKESNGYSTGIVFDKFDFALMLKQMYTESPNFITFANNAAYLLQQLRLIKKFYIFIEFKIKL